MKKYNWRRASSITMGATLALALGATGAAADANDAWITTKAKIALLTTSDLTATGVNVDTIGGKVTLHGTVPAQADKTRAAAVAGGIDGVKSVNNVLQVVPAKNEEQVAAKDDQIKEQVTKALAGDQRLTGSEIEVGSVNKGVVLLEGKADSMSDHLEALNVAGKVAGVRRVESQVQAADRLTDAGTGTKMAQGTSDALGAAGSTANDMWITSSAKMRLLADGNTPALDINVDTRDGVVTLFGIVPSEAAMKAAEADTRKVSGVKNVRNELQVVAAAKRDAVEAKDDDIERGVEQSLEKNAQNEQVDVAVKDGVVRLTGSVDSETDRVAAGFTARSIPGVRAVLVEDLRVSERG